MRENRVGSCHAKCRGLGGCNPAIKTFQFGRLRLKCDGTRAENIFLLSAKRTSPFKSAGASVQSTAGS